MQPIACPVPGIYTCQECGYETPQKHCYKRHIKQHDQGPVEGYLCPVISCGQVGLDCSHLLKRHLFLHKDMNHIQFYRKYRIAIDDGFSPERKELQTKMKCLLIHTEGGWKVKDSPAFFNSDESPASPIASQKDLSDSTLKNDHHKPVAGFACPVKDCETAALKCTRLVKRHIPLSRDKNHMQFYEQNRVAIDEGLSPERKELRARMESLIIKHNSRWKPCQPTVSSTPAAGISSPLNLSMQSDDLAHTGKITALENDLGQDEPFSFYPFEIFPSLNDMLEEGEKKPSKYLANTRLDPFSCSSPKKQKTELTV